MKVKMIDTCSRLAHLAEDMRIGNDFILLDSSVPDKSAFNCPYKLDVLVGSLIVRGSVKGLINLDEYQISAPCLITVLPGQILQLVDYSDDFSVVHVIYSKEFINTLSKFFNEKFIYHLDFHNNPVLELTGEESDSFANYYSKVRKALSDLDNPYRTEVITHITMLFFYEVSYRYHQTSERKPKTSRERLVDNFLNLVQANHAEHRLLDFYADKLCITPKYLTTLVKKQTGTSATDWIEKYVILEAKAMLKSTNLTIQQISEELNFSSQTFFGKFFRRLAGVSPSDYRKNG
ncbi:MAG: helix-turn-helix domain-containing protein [Prevotellaceae bacterium]|jgi:AraC-like DNA-binding protein|nr:helix-turn-helix domain-containing protein [Prevotellaceae bacterium]